MVDILLMMQRTVKKMQNWFQEQLEPGVYKGATLYYRFFLS
jgi:hypothetical protein